MFRILEVILALAPFAAYGFWRLSAGQGGPSIAVLIAAGTGLVLLIAALFWYASEERLPPGTVYVPPRIEDGRIVPAGTRQEDEPR